MDTNVATDQNRQTKYFMEATVCVSRRFGIFPDTRPVCRAVRSTTGRVLKELGIRAGSLHVSVDKSPDDPRHLRVSIQSEVYCAPDRRKELEDFLRISLEHSHLRGHGSKVSTRQLGQR